MSAELNQYLNSFGSTKWDIPVSEVSLPNQWHYYRQNLLNMGKYMPADNQYTYNFLTADTIVRPSISRVSAEQILGSPEHEIKTQSEGTNTSDYFFKAVDNVSVRVSMKFDYTLKWTGWQNTNDHDIYVKLVKRNGTTDTIISPAILAPVVNITPTPNNTFRITRSVSVDEAFIVDLVENDQLILVADIGANIWGQPNIPPPEGGTPIITRYRIATISNSELFTLEYTAKSSNDVLMDVAEPNAIFQALIDRAAGTPGKFTSVIEWGDLDYKPLFCAAESVRDFQEPQYHTSIDDFLKYMHYSGYEYDIVDRVITFRRRDEFFRSDIEALRLTEDECGDLLIAADNTYAYTAVRIGYNKPDYEEMNGVYEANGVYEYKTDYTDREEIKMDYVIPYRADSMGLEILLNKRDKDTEDDKGDNDVFIVAMDKEIYEETIGNTGLKRYVYVEYRDTLITYQSAPIRLEMFNAPLNPYFLVLANESLIGVNVKRLIYAGTNAAKKRDLEHNPGILITGLGSPMVDVPINKRLFAPERYNIGVGTLQELPSPDKRNGLIYFEHEGVTYKGYILESLKNELREDNSEWIIQAVG